MNKWILLSNRNQFQGNQNPKNAGGEVNIEERKLRHHLHDIEQEPK